MEKVTTEELLEKLGDSPRIHELQEYIASMRKIRGFDKEGVQENMLLLLEEAGELAKAIRKNTRDMHIDLNKAGSYDTVENEMADVLIVLLCVADILGIDIYEAFRNKEMRNSNRTWIKTQDAK